MQVIKTMLNIYAGANALAAKHGLPTHTVKYIGCSDCQVINEGAMLLQYNVHMVAHPKHKSTIGHKVGWTK